MMLLTQQNRKQLPKLYSQDGLGMEAIAHVKFFDPCGSWTWYAMEFDGQDTFYGLVDGNDKELGYFSLTELQGIRGRFGIGIERDMYWKPKKLSEIKN